MSFTRGNYYAALIPPLQLPRRNAGQLNYIPRCKVIIQFG